MTPRERPIPFPTLPLTSLSSFFTSTFTYTSRTYGVQVIILRLFRRKVYLLYWESYSRSSPLVEYPAWCSRPVSQRGRTVLGGRLVALQRGNREFDSRLSHLYCVMPAYFPGRLFSAHATVVEGLQIRRPYCKSCNNCCYLPVRYMSCFFSGVSKYRYTFVWKTMFRALGEAVVNGFTATRDYPPPPNTHGIQILFPEVADSLRRVYAVVVFAESSRVFLVATPTRIWTVCTRCVRVNSMQ